MCRLLPLLFLAIPSLAMDLGCARCPAVQRDLEQVRRLDVMATGSLRHPDTRDSPHAVVDLDARALEELAWRALDPGLRTEVRRRASPDSAPRGQRALLSVSVSFALQEVTLESEDGALRLMLRAVAQPQWELLDGSERRVGRADARILATVPIERRRVDGDAIELRMHAYETELIELVLDTEDLPSNARLLMEELLASQLLRLLSDVGREPRPLLQVRAISIRDQRLAWSLRSVDVQRYEDRRILRLEMSSALYPEERWSAAPVTGAEAFRVQLHPGLPEAFLRAAMGVAGAQTWSDSDEGDAPMPITISSLRAVDGALEVSWLRWSLRRGQCGHEEMSARWDPTEVVPGASTTEEQIREAMRLFLGAPVLVLGAGDERREARGSFDFAENRIERKGAWQTQPRDRH